LQKTLLNVEGMGRELDPALDLWKTAKPYLERWMHERVGLQGLKRELDKEAVQWAQLLPQLPRLVHSRLSRPDVGPATHYQLKQLCEIQRRTNSLLTALLAVLAVAIGLAIWAFLR